MRLGVGCRSRRNGPPFRAAQSGLQRLGDLRGDIAFDGKNIDQLAIVSLRPKMRIVLGVDKSNIDANMVGRFLNRAFQDIGDAELLCDLGDVLG